MNLESRKLRLIEAFSSLEDIKKIEEIESILLFEKNRSDRMKMIDSLSGAWSEEEAEDIKKVISKGCENVDENEW